MSRSIHLDYDTLRARECEAQRRNQQALYELTIQRGNGVFDLPKLRKILTGACDCTSPEPTT